MSQEHSDISSLLWGKSDPYHPLIHHMVDVGCVAQVLLLSPGYRGLKTRLLHSTCCGDETLSWLGFVAALHDIGKCHPDFQGKLETPLTLQLRQSSLIRASDSALSTGFRHEAFGATWVLDYLVDDLGWNRRASRTIAAVIRGHHGDFSSECSHAETARMSAFWNNARLQIVREVGQAFGFLDLTLSDFSDHSMTGLILSGLLVLSDWIASNSSVFVPPPTNLPIIEYAECSRAAAKQAVSQLSLDEVVNWPDRPTFDKLWPDASFSSLRPVQEVCQKLCQEGVGPGLAIIEAPMGEGKTEAALCLAAHWMGSTSSQGLYLALPTAATSNQMYSRLWSFVAEQDQEQATGTRLVHGMAWLLDEKSLLPHAASTDDLRSEGIHQWEWFRPKKRSLLAPYGVGTVDQALMGVLHVRHGFLRLFGLVGKVLVVDEVHAYDAYMTHILTLLLRWCGQLKIPVILLSATLPENRRRELVEAYRPAVSERESTSKSSEYPLVTLVDERGVMQEIPVAASLRKRVALSQHEILGNPGRIAELAIESVRHGGCACVIANTVGSAQQIYGSLIKQVSTLVDGESELELILFHARFPVEQRQVLEQKILRSFDRRSTLHDGHPDYTVRPHRAILVATQVVEQSLDLDFDVMFSEIAPIDSLLQRSGRLHRHHRPNRLTGDHACFHVLLPEKQSAGFGLSELVYEPYLLCRTQQLLRDLEVFELPQDLRRLVEAVYGERGDVTTYGDDDNRLATTYASMIAKRREEEALARRHLIPSPSDGLFTLAQLVGVFSEDDEEKSSYFSAKTRLGDERLRLLMVEGNSFDRELQGAPPGRPLLQQLYLWTVEVPAWWFRRVQAEHPWALPCQAPSWMPGVLVLRLKGGMWRGIDCQGRGVSIINDRELGVLRKVESERS